jgi:hypothetical protein
MVSTVVPIGVSTIVPIGIATIVPAGVATVIGTVYRRDGYSEGNARPIRRGIHGAPAGKNENAHERGKSKAFHR